MIIRIFYALLLMAHPLVNVDLERVIDGDTIQTDLGSVRILGINAPEKGDKCFQESSDFLESLLEDRVALERDFVNKDKYGRLLRYVHSPKSVSLEMVQQGYAKAYCLFPNYKYCEALEESQAYAMNVGVGCLWNHSPNMCFRIREVSKDGDWVKIKNHCSGSVPLLGVYIESDGRQREDFSGELCSGCEETKSIEVGRFVMLFDDGGLIDFQGA